MTMMLTTNDDYDDNHDDDDDEDTFFPSAVRGRRVTAGATKRRDLLPNGARIWPTEAAPGERRRMMGVRRG